MFGLNLTKQYSFLLQKLESEETLSFLSGS